VCIASDNASLNSSAMKSILVSSLLFASGRSMTMLPHNTESGLLQMPTAALLEMGTTGACNAQMSKQDCAKAIAAEIVVNARKCYSENSVDESSYNACVQNFCGHQCSKGEACENLCISHANPLFARLAAKTLEKDAKLTDADPAQMDKAQLMKRSEQLQHEQQDAMAELQEAQQRMVDLNGRIKARAEAEIRSGNKAKGEEEMAKVQMLGDMQQQIDGHLAKVQAFTTVAVRQAHQSGMGLVQNKASPKKAATLSFLQQKAPEDELAKEMTHDLEMNFNKIAPFGKEDTAKELQDHAAKTQDTLVDAVENAEVAEIKRAVFRALTRLRAATIKEFDTIARLETQAIDAYNDAHHYRAENPLAHLHEDEAPVETDTLKSFH